MLLHHFQDVDKSIEVVPIIHKRFLNRFANSLARSKMHYTNGIAMVVENLVHGKVVGYIRLVECGAFACNFFNSIKNIYVRVG